MSKRELLVDSGYEDCIVFDDPEFDEAIIGVTTDNCVVYDFNLMVQHLMDQDGIGNVSFYADNKVTLDSDGLSSADVFKIGIPGETPGYVEPDKYTGADGTWTLQKDDYIVLGKGEAIEKPKVLEEKAIRINSFSDNRRGSLPHFRVGGQ